ncbi:MAG: hypothetical protein LLG04_13795 [Parachlamydia sp.]|nr:hypothetical protein [Parachlamydia sp.]
MRTKEARVHRSNKTLLGHDFRNLCRQALSYDLGSRASRNVSQDLQSNETLFPPELVRQKAEQIQYFGPAQSLYTHAWDRVKEE